MRSTAAVLRDASGTGSRIRLARRWLLPPPSRPCVHRIWSPHTRSKAPCSALPAADPKTFVVHVPLDPMAAIRMTPVLDPGTIPGTPDGFQTLDASVKPSLYKVAGNQNAELHDALGEMGARKAQLQADLGKHCPDGQVAEDLAARLDRIATGKAQAPALLTYYEDLEDVAIHDGMAVAIKGNKKLLQAADDDDKVLDRYPKLALFGSQRSSAISDGMAKAADKKAAAATSPK